MWPRERSEGLLARGMAGLEVAVEKTEAFHAACHAPAEPEDLLQWLNHNKQTMKEVHRTELLRRGLTLSGTW